MDIVAVVQGEKKLVPMNQVKAFSSLPHYRSLSVEVVWPQVRNDERLLQYMPDVKAGHNPPRDFFFAVLSAIYPEEFENLLQKTLDDKNTRAKEAKRFIVAEDIAEQLNNQRDYFSFMKPKNSQHYMHHGRKYRSWD